MLQPSRILSTIVVALVCLAVSRSWSLAHATEPLLASYEKQVRPLIQKYCVDCHGAEKPDGNVRLDEGQDVDKLLADKQLWWRVLKNVRAEMMPPASADQPEAQERRELIHWIETAVAAWIRNIPIRGLQLYGGSIARSIVRRFKS